MNIATTIDVLDLITIRECIEILVDRRTVRDRLLPLSPAAVEQLGTTHIRPRTWSDEAKNRVRQALIGGEISLYASRKIGNGTNAISDEFVRIPSELLGRSVSFRIALPAEVLLVRGRDSLAPFQGSEIRIRRSELEAWLRRHRKLFDQTKFRRRSPRRSKPGRPAHESSLAISVFRELYPWGPPAGKTQRELARELVAATKSRFGKGISLRTAQRAVVWASKRRSRR